MEIENGYIFESGTPILRWVMLSMEDSVKVRLADRDDFDILKWVGYKLSPYVNHMFSLIPIRQHYFFILVVVFFIAYHWYMYCRETAIQIEPIAVAKNWIRRRPLARRRQ